MTHPSLTQPFYMAGKKKEEPVSNSDPYRQYTIDSAHWTGVGNIGPQAVQGIGVVTTDNTALQFHNNTFIPSQQQLNQQLVNNAVMVRGVMIYTGDGQVAVRERTKMVDPTFSLEEIEEAQEFIQKLNADRQQLPAH